MSTAIDKNKLDTVQIFEAFVTFGGNATKTAVACNVDPEIVEALAKAEGWPAKVKRWTELSDGDPREVQVQINRAINYVQARRLRSLLDEVIRHLGEGSAEELISKLTCETAHGPQFKTRSLCDLVKAAEAVHLMTQRSLGDSPSEAPSSGNQKPSNIGLAVLAALNAAETDLSLDSVEVVKRELSDAIPRPPKVSRS